MAQDPNVHWLGRPVLPFETDRWVGSVNFVVDRAW